MAKYNVAQGSSALVKFDHGEGRLAGVGQRGGFFAWALRHATLSQERASTKMEKDWRYEHLQTQPYLRGVRWEMKTYKAPRADWDHDHCVGCWAKFMEHDSPSEPIEHEGYATTAGYPKGAEYEWVCKTCFADFGEAMGWTAV